MNSKCLGEVVGPKITNSGLSGSRGRDANKGTGVVVHDVYAPDDPEGAVGRQSLRKRGGPLSAQLFLYVKDVNCLKR